MKVTVKEWRVMSDHNKQLLLNAVATKQQMNKQIVNLTNWNLVWL